MVLKTILVPVDGSEKGFNALKYAMSLSKDCGGKIVVSTVSLPYAFSEAAKEYDSAVSDLVTTQIPPKKKSKAGDIISDVSKDLVLMAAKKKVGKNKALNIEYRRIISEDPAKAIVDQAAAIKADIIIMGNRGMGQFAEILLGSVGNKVISFAKCPVVIVK